MKPSKQPYSVLVVIHTQNQALLLSRADAHTQEGESLWQSVTGSLEMNETPTQAAWRELAEETGFSAADGTLTDSNTRHVYEIYPRWRHRYAHGVTHNTESVFYFLLSDPKMPELAPKEHLDYQWLDFNAAANLVFSPSNQAALLNLNNSNKVS
ncbi:MAG: dihydroneopterin triphosphate diphosphatase [Neisseriaceae bacterium]|nr:dihydroneopterin triphosphate diphosphatase [Neisseriaceae bacterium]